MARLEKNYFKIDIRKIYSTPSQKDGVSFIDESYSLRIKREGRSIGWIVNLEIYTHYKVALVSFFLSVNGKNSKIAKFKRNTGKHCIDPAFTLSLFRHCFEICRNACDATYSFGFYALDDDLEEKKEDMNKRMSSYTTFLSRIADRTLPGYQQAGNVTQNLLIIYDPKVSKLTDVEEFIRVYQPIIEAEVNSLYGEKESHRLKM